MELRKYDLAIEFQTYHDESPMSVFYKDIEKYLKWSKRKLIDVARIVEFIRVYPRFQYLAIHWTHLRNESSRIDRWFKSDKAKALQSKSKGKSRRSIGFWEENEVIKKGDFDNLSDDEVYEKLTDE